MIEDENNTFENNVERTQNEFQGLNEDKELELRMYFFTVSSLKGIAQGIQCGHSALEYVRMHGLTEEFNDFITNWKTWIILNGGITNEHRDFEGIVQGSLNKIADDLLENDIKFGYFQEPDLNDALTAVCFICDERVFNKKDYPDFVDYIFDVKMYPVAREEVPEQNYEMIKMQTSEIHQEMFPEYYKEWVRFMGGIKNVFLRELIQDKKLA
jgi:hypothetical protein